MEDIFFEEKTAMAAKEGKMEKVEEAGQTPKRV
jgi:hypothetical protein